MTAAPLSVQVYHNVAPIDPQRFTGGLLQYDSENVELVEAYRFQPDVAFLEGSWGLAETLILERLFAWDNKGYRPWGIRSLSTGDVVIFKYPTYMTGWACEWVGWKQIELTGPQLFD